MKIGTKTITLGKNFTKITLNLLLFGHLKFGQNGSLGKFLVKISDTPTKVLGDFGQLLFKSRQIFAAYSKVGLQNKGQKINGKISEMQKILGLTPLIEFVHKFTDKF